MNKKNKAKKNIGKCCFCKKSTQGKKSGIVLYNEDNGELFRFMNKNEQSHLECYVEAGVKQSIKKYLKE